MIDMEVGDKVKIIATDVDIDELRERGYWEDGLEEHFGEVGVVAGVSFEAAIVNLGDESTAWPRRLLKECDEIGQENHKDVVVSIKMVDEDSRRPGKSMVMTHRAASSLGGELSHIQLVVRRRALEINIAQGRHYIDSAAIERALEFLGIQHFAHRYSEFLVDDQTVAENYRCDDHVKVGV